MVDLQKTKRNRMTQTRGQEVTNQIEHIDSAGAKMVIGGVLVAGTLIPAASDISTTPYQVKTGTLLRIQVAADTYVAFGDEPASAPLNAAIDATTSPALKLPAGYHLVVATGDFIRTSANPTRVEMITE